MPQDPNIEDIYPLSPMQSGMLFHTIYEPNSGLYVEQAVYQLEGPLDVAALKRGWEKVISRHAVLRTLFLWEKRKKPLQVVRRKVRLPWHEEDWSPLSAEARTRRLEQYLKDDRERGFELGSAPLLRFALFRQGPKRACLVWTHHHILLDGWSMPVLFKEVMTCYQAYRQGQEPHLASAPAYKHFIAWLGKRDPDAAREFWLSHFAGWAGPTPLPLASESGAQLRDFAKFTRTLPRETTGQLKSLARSGRTTLNTLVQYAWALVLQRYTGQSDIVFGAVLSGRPAELEGVERTVGLFINSLPIRVDLRADLPAFEQLAALQLHNAHLESHAHVSLSDLNRWCKLDPKQKLFESLIAFENYPSEAKVGEQQELVASQLQVIERTNYGLNILISPDDELWFQYLFDRSQLSENKVRELALAFERALRALLAHPQLRPSQHALYDGSSVSLMESAAVKVDCDLSGQLKKIAGACGAQIALVQGAQRLSYAQLQSQADQISAHLDQRGLASEAVVALLLERGALWIVAQWAALQSGKPWVSIDPSLPSERIQYLLKDSGAAVLIALPENHAKINCEQMLWLDPSGLVAGGEVVARTARPFGGSASRGALAVPVRPERLAYLIYTSGSTGHPKGVMISREALAHFCHWAKSVFGLRAGTRCTQIAGLGFDATIFEIWAGLMAGCQLHIAPANQTMSLEQIYNWYQAEQIEFAFVPTPIAELLLELDWSQASFPRGLATGGDRLKRGPRDKQPFKLFNVYGPSEVTVIATFEELDGASPNPPAIGLPAPGVRAYLLDGQLRPVAPGMIGELYLGGPQLARGYFGQPAHSAENFVPNPFSTEPGARLYRTGDLALLPLGPGESDPRKLAFVGRRDFQVKIRGIRIELGEIDAVLSAHPQVSQAQTLLVGKSVPHLLSFVTTSASPAELLAELKRDLPGYMIPAAILVLDAMPLTDNGKIDRKQLARLAEQQPFGHHASSQSATAREPKTGPVAPALSSAAEAQGRELESRLAQIWSEVLQQPQIQPDDNFFELGGDSILSIQILSRAVRAGMHFTLAELFANPSLRGLAQLVQSGSSAAVEQQAAQGELPLTPIQRWFFSLPLPNPHHFNQSLMLAVPSNIGDANWQELIGYLTRQHDAFRIRFRFEEGRWIQAYCDESALPALEILHCAPAEIEPLAERFQTRLQITDGPLARILLLRTGGERDRLLLILHHLIVDGVSWRILLDDLSHLYQRQQAGEALWLPPRTASFKRWSNAIQALAQQKYQQAERGWWRALCEKQLRSLPTDLAANSTANSLESCESLMLQLDPEQTAELLVLPNQAYQMRVDEFLLSALLRVLGEWSGNRTFAFEMESHGRDAPLQDLDLSRTLGWFTAVFPLLLELPPSDEPAQLLKKVKESCRAVPDSGIGWSLLRYLAEASDLAGERDLDAIRAYPTPPVSFNYLGRFDNLIANEQLFGHASESTGLEITPEGSRSQLFNLNALVREGRLRIAWTYSRNLHQRATVERLGALLLQQIGELLEHCRQPNSGQFTSSDFPGARLDQAQLEGFLADLEF